jgi:hypothetical protein
MKNWIDRIIREVFDFIAKPSLSTIKLQNEKSSDRAAYRIALAARAGFGRKNLKGESANGAEFIKARLVRETRSVINTTPISARTFCSGLSRFLLESAKNNRITAFPLHTEDSCPMIAFNRAAKRDCIG